MTVDFGTLGQGEPVETDTVTVRDRDTMEQERVKVNDLAGYIRERLS